MRRSGAFCPWCALRALTMPGCPRMLQVALRACAPRTEQVALASVADLSVVEAKIPDPGPIASKLSGIGRSDTGSRRGSTYDLLSVPESFP
ncbi:hypothetical protein GTW54_05220 [Streptomyces sp. SID5468]|nr:hypothetical protein [Streptomyces sp. SID5468]